MSSSCEQELCDWWNGFTCVCALVEDRDEQYVVLNHGRGWGKSHAMNLMIEDAIAMGRHVHKVTTEETICMTGDCDERA